MKTIESNFTHLLVTGGAGFIGSNFIRFCLEENAICRITNLDKLTYAGNLLSLADVEERFGRGCDSRYRFVHGDIQDEETVYNILLNDTIDAVVHLAAETHVDRSILGPASFLETNVNGTFRLLEACRRAWGTRNDVRFHHVSTDEVFGSLGADNFFHEKTPYDPSSPYSASKAASDHLVRAWHRTYGLPVTISHCSNNYGPFQFPEKLIPLAIRNCLHGTPIPIYGKGENIRDWLHVRDHCRALWMILHRGISGETYNIGSNNECRNIELVRNLCSWIDRLGATAKGIAKSEDLITWVEDRPGHDFRYAIDSRKLRHHLGWHSEISMEEGIRETVSWYIQHSQWCEAILSGEYMHYYQQQYGKHGRTRRMRI